MSNLLKIEVKKTNNLSINWCRYFLMTSLVTFSVFRGGFTALGAIHYVDQNCSEAVAPYTNWATAATSIQAAVAVANSNDTVLVTNGTYALSAEILIVNSITVESQNGPEFSTVNGGGAYRCFNLGGAACIIDGFTITGGYTLDEGGGIYCSDMTPLVTNCIFIGNAANDGGGMHEGVATHCMFLNNSAGDNGGGRHSGMANNCLFFGNSATNGGGMYYSMANNCVFSGNSAVNDGGGIYFSTANNCTFVGNTADSGGGLFFSTANNCIAWSNEATSSGANLYSTDAYYTCAPDVINGTNNCITNHPAFVNITNGNYRLQVGSPCINAGDNSEAVGNSDIEGNLRINGNIVDMGAYEFMEWFVDANHGDDAQDGLSWTSATRTIQAALDMASDWYTVWVTNGTYFPTTELFVTQRITIVSANGPQVTMVNGGGSNRCFNLNSAACTISGFTITNGYAVDGGGIYCGDSTPFITNCIITGNSASDNGGGIYEGTLSHCTVAGNAASFGGGIHAGTANNCSFSSNSASFGGGMHEGTANYCSFSSNAAFEGGGMFQSTANSCIFVGNTANKGGGMCDSTANNCTLFDNSASEGGGIYEGIANNSIAWYNEATASGNDVSGTAAFYTCSPDLSNGVNGCITSNPLFIDFTNGNFRLQADSPCINTGDNARVVGDLDLDGHSRIMNEIVDMGAYESYRDELFVDGENGDDTQDGLSWTTPFKTIQAALDVALDDWMVWVSNGTYDLSAEIIVTHAVTIQSVNGPENTIVDGGGSNRCFNLTNTVCMISGFTITHGYAAGDGGGIYCSATNAIIRNCILSGNTATNRGGGIYNGTVNNGILTGNSAAYGGGMYDGIANNCAFAGNTAGDGGGMYGGTANNGTFTCNAADNDGGGMYNGTANNCIAWYNEEGTNINDLSGTTAHYTCSPDVAQGIEGCITNEPILISSFHIATNSLCRGSGSTNYLQGTDIDNDVWLDPPSMGCDEPGGTANGPIQLEIIGLPSNTTAHYTEECQILVMGQASSFHLNFGNGHVVTNNLRAENIWTLFGEYDVILTAYNTTYPAGISITQHVSVAKGDDTTVYVAPGGHDTNSGTSWATAKATIQAGVNAQTSSIAGAYVYVSNGIYHLTSEIAVTNDISIYSINGPTMTIVNGGDSTRCFNLTNAACTISGFSITHGNAALGGGIFCSGTSPVINHCTLSGNTATYGGGMHKGIANNCTFISNTAVQAGGGMYDGMANNSLFFGNTATDGGGMSDSEAYSCTFISNTADSGGGMHTGTADNCIAWYNEGNDLSDTTAHYTCSPDAPHGVNGCITNHPVFADFTQGNFRLQGHSPCRNTGDNTATLTAYDLDENPRIYEEIVDMGAYEFTAWFVDTHNGDDAHDGHSWTSATRTIQVALDMASESYTVWVTNGTYHLNTEIIVTQAITIQSVNGPENTKVNGGGSNRCFHLADTACTISGFTLTNGYAPINGGGIYCSDTNPLVNKCILTGNTAENDGGGIYGGRLNNSILIHNSAGEDGGGITARPTIAPSTATRPCTGAACATPQQTTVLSGPMRPA